MGKKKYEVLVKDNTNQYICGRISGILLALSGSKARRGYANRVIPAGPNMEIFRVRTTRRRYLKMKKLIDLCYPDLCEFDE